MPDITGHFVVGGKEPPPDDVRNMLLTDFLPKMRKQIVRKGLIAVGICVFRIAGLTLALAALGAIPWAWTPAATLPALLARLFLIYELGMALSYGFARTNRLHNEYQAINDAIAAGDDLEIREVDRDPEGTTHQPHE